MWWGELSINPTKCIYFRLVWSRYVGIDHYQTSITLILMSLSPSSTVPSAPAVSWILTRSSNYWYSSAWSSGSDDGLVVSETRVRIPDSSAVVRSHGLNNASLVCSSGTLGDRGSEPTLSCRSRC